MKILLATNDFPPLKGGIATVSVGIVRQLLAMGHEVVALVPTQCVSEAKAIGAQVWGVPGYGSLPTRLLGMWIALSCAMVAWRPDVVMGMNVSYAGPVLLLRGRRGCRWVLSAFGYEFLKWPRVRAFQRWVQAFYRRADALLVVSEHMLHRLVERGISPEKILVLHVSPSQLPACSSERTMALKSRWGGGDLIFLTVARLVRRKGIDGVILALPEVMKVFPSVRYWVVGDGPERRRLEDLSRDLGIRESVSFLGEVSPEEMSACYSGADIFVMVPWSDERRGDVEGLGLTYLEAGLAGLPCIGSDSGGVPEAVIDRETGLIVPERDPQALAQALLYLAADPASRKSMGEAGRARARALFGEDSMKEDLARLVGGSREL